MRLLEARDRRLESGHCFYSQAHQKSLGVSLLCGYIVPTVCLAVFSMSGGVISCADSTKTGVDPDISGDDILALTFSVETSLSSSEIPVGEPVEIGCLVTPPQLRQPATSVELVGEADTLGVLSGHTFRACMAGDYEVRCRIALTEIFDKTTEMIKVVPPVTIPTTIKIDPNQAQAGDAVSVVCSQGEWECENLELDPSGWSVTIDPQPEYQWDGEKIVINDTGEYMISCVWNSVHPDSMTTTLKIVAGPVNAVETVFLTTEALVGDTLHGFCEATDSHGNPIDLLEAHDVSLVVPPILEKTGTSITTTTAGIYEVACQVDGIIDAEPAKVTFLPVDPGGFSVELDPAKSFYTTENSIRVVPSIEDEFGNPIEVTAQALLIDCDPQVDIKANDEFSPVSEGSHECTICLEDWNLCANAEFMVDDGPPSIAVVSPARAAMLTGNDTITVSGTVHDPGSGVDGVWVNGQQATLGEGGAFSAAIGAKFGLNVISVQAQDGVGQTLPWEWSQSFYWSPEIYPMSCQDATTISHGIEAAIAQIDLDCSCPQGDDNLLEPLRLLAESFEPNDYLPWTFGSYSLLGCGYTFVLDDMAISNRWVLLTTEAGKLVLDVVFSGLEASVVAQTSGQDCINLNAGVNCSNVTLTLETTPVITSEGTLSLDVLDADLTVGSVEVIPGPDSPLIALKSWIGGYVSQFLQDKLQEQVADPLEPVLAALIEEAVHGGTFAESLSIPALADGAPPTELTVAFQLSDVVVQENGIHAVSVVSIAPGPSCSCSPCKPALANACGTLAGDDLLLSIAPWQEVSAGLAHSDVLNLVLWSAWAGGVFEWSYEYDDPAKLAPELSLFDALVVKLSPALPPVLNDCGMDGPVVQIGDLGVTLEFFVDGFSAPVISAKLWFAAEMSVALTLDDAQQSLDVTGADLVLLGKHLESEGGDLAGLVSEMLPEQLVGDAPLMMEFESWLSALELHWNLPMVSFSLPMPAQSAPQDWTLLFDAVNSDWPEPGWIGVTGNLRISPE